LKQSRQKKRFGIISYKFKSIKMGISYKIIGCICFLIAINQIFAQDSLSGKQYLPCQQEIVFKKEVLKNCFGIKSESANNIENSNQGSVIKPTNSFSHTLPFSFVLGNLSSRNFLSQWKLHIKDSLTTERNYYVLRWVNPENTFEIRCNIIDYVRYPTVEWKLYFKNIGKVNSPIVERVLPLDAVFILSDQGKIPGYAPILHYNKGSENANTDFMPVNQVIDIDKKIHIESRNGRSSESFLPFWNLEYNGSGLVTAIGWSGNWHADFSFIPDEWQSTMKAGMTNIQLYLKPGEEISSPSVCLLYWEGKDTQRANNLFRRFMREMVQPKWEGREPFVCGMSGCASILDSINEKNQIDYIRKIAGCGANVYWLDAGWSASLPRATWWTSRGNWFPDKRKFPHGMKVLSDEAHKNGLKFLLWFDPEVVAPGTEIAIKHPEWVIKKNEKENGLFDLGNPDALNYIINLISLNINNWDIDIYRNDYNIDPGDLWPLGDESRRTGITEIRYVEGLYKFWDGLIKRKPGLLIDNCASGGRRIDYETCKRSIPLWRSDYQCEYHPDIFEASQNQTYALNEYLPFNSIGFDTPYDKYGYRSISSCSLSLYVPLDPTGGTNVTIQKDKLKKLWDDIKFYNYLMIYDYYPLTDFSLKQDTWMAMQYDCPEKGEGCLICYRRPDAPGAEVEFDLKAIDPDAGYKLTYVDSGEEKIVKGTYLKRLSIRLERRESMVMKYMKIKE
jgi:alpha-galactosidase